MLKTTHDLFAADLPETAEISQASDFCAPGASQTWFTDRQPSSVHTVLRHTRLESPAATQSLAVALLAAKEKHQRIVGASYPGQVFEIRE